MKMQLNKGSNRFIKSVLIVILMIFFQSCFKKIKVGEEYIIKERANTYEFINDSIYFSRWRWGETGGTHFGIYHNINNGIQFTSSYVTDYEITNYKIESCNSCYSNEVQILNKYTKEVVEIGVKLYYDTYTKYENADSIGIIRFNDNVKSVEFIEDHFREGIKFDIIPNDINKYVILIGQKDFNVIDTSFFIRNNKFKRIGSATAAD